MGSEEKTPSKKSTKKKDDKKSAAATASKTKKKKTKKDAAADASDGKPVRSSKKTDKKTGGSGRKKSSASSSSKTAGGNGDVAKSKAKKSSRKNASSDAEARSKVKSKTKSKSKRKSKARSKASSNSATVDDTVKANSQPVKEGVCIICKDASKEPEVTGSHCKHAFCLSCLEQRLARPIPGPPRPEDNHLGAPTLGRCPECNAELRKFGVKDRKKGKPYYEKHRDIATTPLAGKVYVRKQTDSDKPPIGTFHFDSDQTDDKGFMLPYIDFSEAIEHDEKEEIWVLNNGEPVPDRKYFDPGCHYDAETRTFHGSVSWKSCRFQGSHRWDVILGFTRDFSVMRVGLIHKRKERLGVVAVSSDRHRLLYPLDGRWKLSWKNADGEEQNGTVNVRNNEFRQGPYTFNLMLDDAKTAGFRWPLDPIYASAKSGLDLDEKMKGPGIGKKIVWETTHPSFPEMKWVRETIGDDPIQATEHLGPAPYEYVEEGAETQSADADANADAVNNNSESDEESENGWDDSISDSGSYSDDSEVSGSSSSSSEESALGDDDGSEDDDDEDEGK